MKKEFQRLRWNQYCPYLFALLIIAVLLVPQTARAGFIVNLNEDGTDVVANGIGTLNLAGLHKGYPGTAEPHIRPQYGVIFLGSNITRLQTYDGTIVGPGSFGPGKLSGDFTLATSGSGSPVSLSVWGDYKYINVPEFYNFTDSLTSTATFSNLSFETLGVEAGSYTWNWGSGKDADFFTLNIGTPVISTVPEPATLLLLGFGLLGVAGVSRKRN